MDNRNNYGDELMVSVICITYGHEEFIAQALESFISQRTNFKYQILVGEDKGPDKTAQIVLDYAKRYPDLIKPFIREKNMGAQRNLIDLCRRAGTKYVAFCEGDDYWTDDTKLQRQFDLMEKHPEYRACFHNTKIVADESWYLGDWYIPDENGDIFIPSSIPGYDNTLRSMKMDYYIEFGPAHTSSIFYRWDNSRDIPEWYYKHIYGDHSLMMIQAGDEPIGYIPRTMSAYRRSDVGIIMYESKTDHFLKSRASWIDMAMDIEDYFKKYYNDFANKEIKARIVREFNNYIRYIIKSGDTALLRQAYRDYAYPAELAALNNDSVQRKLNLLNELYTEEGVGILIKDEELQESVKSKVDDRKRKRVKYVAQKERLYNKYASVPKDKKLWVFSSESYKAFSNNTRHLYEYIIAFHPEINPVWITRNNNMLKLAAAENLPMVKVGSRECTDIMKRAAVVFVNQSKTRGARIKGFNRETKIVRLGNGSSLRDISKDELYDTAVFSPSGTPEGVIEANPNKYGHIKPTALNRGFFVEEYEKTLLQVVPNSKNAEIYHRFFGIPKENILVCGAPRNLAVPDNTGDRRRKILLSPAIRMLILNQEGYADDLYENIDMINERLVKMGIFMDVYIDYGCNAAVRTRMKDMFDRHTNIDMLDTNDIFHDLPNYELMINDYNNIMYDFILDDRPVVIFNRDKSQYLEKTSLMYDYDDVMPGEQADNWKDVMDMVEARLADPSIDAEKRAHARGILFDMSVTDKNCSERIIEAVKDKLGFNDDTGEY